MQHHPFTLQLFAAQHRTSLTPSEVSTGACSRRSCSCRHVRRTRTNSTANQPSAGSGGPRILSGSPTQADASRVARRRRPLTGRLSPGCAVLCRRPEQAAAIRAGLSILSTKVSLWP